jgi:ribose transport system permease protein
LTNTNLAPTNPRAARFLKTLAGAWSWLFLIFIVIFFEIWARAETGNTFVGRIYNLQSILLASTQILMLALGLTFVIISAGIDLSVAFTSGLAAIVMAVLIRALGPQIGDGPAFAIGVVVALLAALVPGFVNGWLVANLNVPSFIGTLGMYGIARGAAFLIGGGATVAIRNSFARELGNGRVFGDAVPIPVLSAIIITLVAHYVLKHTKFGLYTYAMGGNLQSALRAGVDVKRMTIVIFMLSALTAAIAGIFYTARFSAGAADAGEPILLYSVAAIFIGGASLSGGSGTVVGTVIGSLIIAVIQFGLVFIGVPPYWQFVAVGTVIIIAVLIDQFRDQLATVTQGEGA